MPVLSEGLHYNEMLQCLGGFGIYQRYCLSWYTVSSMYLAAHLGFMTFATANEDYQTDIRNRSHWSDIRDGKPEFYSIVNEWNLFGEKMSLPIRATSVQLAGFLFGYGIGGQLSDLYGRKGTFLVFFGISFVLSIVCSLSTSFPMFMATRFFIGLSTAACCAVQFVWYIEAVPNHSRLLNHMFGYNVGYLYFALVAYLCQDWRKLCLWGNAAGGVLLPLTLGLEESPKWLISKRRYHNAIRIFRRIGHYNGTERQILELRFEIEGGEVDKKNFHSFWHLFYSKQATFHTLSLAFTWVAISTTFFSLAYNIANFSGGLYLNYALIGIIRTITVVVINICDRRWKKIGRKTLAQTGLATLAICCCSMALVYGTRMDRDLEGILAWLMILALGLGSAISWVFAEIYIAELFPTIIRGIGYGFCGLLGCLGCLMMPDIFVIAYSWRPLPFMVFTVLCSASAIWVYFFLPETKNQHLSDFFGNKQHRLVIVSS